MRILLFKELSAVSVEEVAVRHLSAIMLNERSRDLYDSRIIIAKTEELMRQKLAVVFVAAVILLVQSVALFAHHGTASFDDKTISLKGTVTEWVWSNPHCFLKFDVKDQSGNVAHWAVETQAPSTMVQWGWARTSFKAGDEVTVTLQPVKNGAPIGSTRTVTFADGTVLVANGVSPNPPSAK